jgi:tetratricopeptide (TPR) repeat protein
VLLDQEEAALALAMSTQLLQRKQPITPAIRQANVKILAHGSFALADFRESEIQFRRLLAMQQQQTSPTAEDIRESIAVSIYHQSETARLENKGDLAVNHLLRIAQVAPSSTLAANGQIDAAALLLDLQRWSEAETLVGLLKNDLHDHPRAAEFDAMYLQSQEGQHDWAGAAMTLLQMADATVDPALAAAQLWQAITYYRQAQQVSQAIVGYRLYVTRFPKPVAQRLEALDQLSVLLTQTGSLTQREQVLRDIIALNAGLHDKATPRSRFLAAKSAVILADDLYRIYQAVPLEPPLLDSLKRKQAAMSRAVGAYQLLQGLGVAAYQGHANYHLGDIYQQLATELLTSMRPIGLDADAVAAYEILLEEQAYPFEELAIELHEVNVALGWRQGYDEWVVMSLGALAGLSPARYAKIERVVEYAHEIL